MEQASTAKRTGLEIAIIGLAGRFPGASNVTDFWRNLYAGKECISFFTAETLLAAGIDAELVRQPNYVKAHGVLDGADLFDAAFFKFPPREAEIMDPQHRVFLECAWEALEDAGYAVEEQRNIVGVFAGSSINHYLLQNLSAARDILNSHQLVLASDKDFLATRVAYKLNLQGPALTIQTACSTSLVAVHMACQSLLNGECDIALAGGVSVNVPLQSGYLYQEGGIQSPDGHCRAFDARAQGTVGGNGVGIVVLRRLEDALEARDSIHALIKGSAINNDGALKAGFTAPSANGQARAIQAALTMAEVEAETISYIEAHGTGTRIGDPIEIQGLAQAFASDTTRKNFCALGSVKTNIGHLDAAAGIAGLIKTVLMLKHRQILPSLHFEQANPQIAFADSPFYVCNTRKDWETAYPRRAGVSSFGMGGTNAHVILEEAGFDMPVHASRSWQLLVVSAKTATALDRATNNLASHLRAHPILPLADVAHTLQVGRSSFSQRRVCVCRNREEASSLLTARDPERVFTAEAGARSVAFLFPGQGAQHVNMGLELYQQEPTFRACVDRCAEVFAPYLESDMRAVLYPQAEAFKEAEERLHTTRFAQPALFTIEYALAQLWQEWGIMPQAMLGHSVGEFVAACLAGVFTLDDALRLIAMRGQLMQSLPEGAMLSVPLPEEEVLSLLTEQLSLAALNSPGYCVVSGPRAATEALREKLLIRNINCRYLQTSHAFHSTMMNPILEPFADQVKQVRLHEPQMPYLSNITGTWVTAREATDPFYWAQHIRQPVRFSAGLQTLLRDSAIVLLEVGPGQTLSTLAREVAAQVTALSSLPHTRTQSSAAAHLLTTLGKLWAAGVPVDWEGFGAHEQRQRVSLPPYPFERQRYWLTPPRSIKPGEATTIAPLTPGKDTPSMEIAFQSRSSSPRLPTILARVKHIAEMLAGIPSAQIGDDIAFVEINFDSLLLLQFNQAVQEQFGVKVALRQLFEDYPTFARLAAYLDQVLPPERHEQPAAPTLAERPAAPVSVPGNSVVAEPSSMERQTAVALPLPTPPGQTAFVPSFQQNGRDSVPAVPSGIAQGGSIERLLEGQLNLMTQQLELLKGSHAVAYINMPVSSPPVPIVSQAMPVLPAASEESSAKRTVSFRPLEKEPYVPYQPVQLSTTSLNQRQQTYLAAFTERFTKRTQGSKRLTQESRAVLADPIASTGYRQVYKELTYPLFATRSVGSRIWDVDGNEYIDIAMGFGVHLFGHAPDFVMEAINRQLKEGIPIGTQVPLVGEVARLACELTGMERVMFANSGTDAVMVALRIARTASGRAKVVMFAGSYHGTYEGVLARMVQEHDEVRTLPVAPGIPAHMVEDVLVLPYDDPRSLEMIESQAHELAAVLVEPVQSRRPDLQPGAFLQELRRITERRGVALIFDEVITGFRVHQGGAQAWFGVHADLATYSKVVGGGLPFSMVAGKARLMDALDGGMWGYGDASYPSKEKTQFGGAFFKHPLSLAAAWAVLNHLKTEGPVLQERLNQLTDIMARTLNSFFEQEQVSIRVVHFGSLFGFAFLRDQLFSDLFFYHLNEKGVYTWRGRTCFLSTAHTREDVDAIVRAVKESVRDMQRGGFFPSPFPDPPTDGQSSSGLTSSASILPPAAIEASAPSDSVSGMGQITRLPLTDVQLQAWIATQMEQNASCAYNESQTLHLRGPLRLTAMCQAVQELVNRHEALRTTFSSLGDYQSIKASATIEVPLHDFSQLAPRERDRQVQAWIADRANQPFDLVQGPLFFADILRLAEEEHLLILSSHHLISDAQSSEVLLTELSQLYTAACLNASNSLAPAMQYSQYAHWLAQQAESPQMVQAEAYWLAQFVGAVSPLQLPTDWPRPALKTYHGAREALTLSQGLASELRKLSRKQGATLFMTLLAAFQLFLHQLTGQDDLVVGVPATGQALVGAKDLVGYCINVLPIRSTLAGNPSFAYYLAGIRKRVLDGYDHQIYTLGKLLQKLNPQRDPGRLPLLMVTCNIERSSPLPGFFELEVESGLNPTVFSKYDLGVTIRETERTLSLSWNYNSDLFAPSTIRHWLALYEAFLQKIVEEPTIRRDALAALYVERAHSQPSPEELEQQQPRVPYPDDVCFQQLFEAQVARTPTALAVVSEQEQLTYQEINTRANQLAHHLRLLGIGPEVPVALCVERSAAMIVGLLGVLKAGGAYIALDPTYPAERLAFMLEDAGAPVLLTNHYLQAQFVVPEHVQVVCIDTDWPAIAQQSCADPASESTAQNLAYLIYTSGSTGHPKCVAIQHRSLVNYTLAICAALQLHEGLHLATVTTLTADLGHTVIFPALASGGCLHVPVHETLVSGQQFASYLAQHPIDVLKIVPSHLNVLLETAEGGTILPRKHLLLGGETLSSELLGRIRALPHTCQISNHYGPTETTVGVLLHPLADTLTYHQAVPLGSALANCEAYILDEQLCPLAVNETGELYIGGDCLARGYLHQPALTAERFVPYPFSNRAGGRLYRTGDLARYLPDRTIEFRGRLDRQVKLHGYRIELDEVEEVIRQQPAIKECAVEVREGKAEMQGLAAYVVLRDGMNLTSTDLRSPLQERLPAYMLPTSFFFLESLPLTSNGKVDRLALAELAPGKRIEEGTLAPARTAMEKQLATLWCTLLGVERVGIHDNFFACGGHSLIAIRLRSHVAATFGVDLPLLRFFELPTIHELAAAIEEAARNAHKAPRAPITPVARQAYRRTAPSLQNKEA